MGVLNEKRCKSMGYKRISCPSNDTNLNCMNKLCSINPNNPNKAICVCNKLNNNGNKWYTFNKNNTAPICNYQSGTSLTDYEKMVSFINNN
jgi:hypothetical protein